ncbi:hypothetical protein [Mesorhizobium sp.]|uniref:hypothetical protein n=1 Tax=Mesorhizobium sp. TaxID=1871066 RepID=UPI000FE9DAD9|nr:hypothetical protein [Mesorhizobium sp.]RWC28412.1 MAG: hypothetical protein EOS27_18800 [Mesorhizobium sp.]TIX21641.1 MAG: hypothetical protein E5V35_28815 [Mesorhizobium sp.]
MAVCSKKFYAAITRMPFHTTKTSHKGPGEERQAYHDHAKHGTHGAPDPERQGQQANIKVNTTHQGHQQDR